MFGDLLLGQAAGTAHLGEAMPDLSCSGLVTTPAEGGQEGSGLG
ncbi:MAG: hypothetical protein QOE51_4349, partial [Actinoplanes sp.]|nr:hypothetical protein [Actinoplanes sp.]